MRFVHELVFRKKGNLYGFLVEPFTAAENESTAHFHKAADKV